MPVWTIEYNTSKLTGQQWQCLPKLQGCARSGTGLCHQEGYGFYQFVKDRTMWSRRLHMICWCANASPLQQLKNVVLIYFHYLKLSKLQQYTFKVIQTWFKGKLNLKQIHWFVSSHHTYLNVRDEMILWVCSCWIRLLGESQFPFYWTWNNFLPG